MITRIQVVMAIMWDNSDDSDDGKITMTSIMIMLGMIMLTTIKMITVLGTVTLSIARDTT